MEGAFGVGALAAELNGLGGGTHAREAGGHAVVEERLIVVGEVLEGERDFPRAVLVGITHGGGDVIRLVHLDPQAGEMHGFTEVIAEQRPEGLEHEHARGAAGFLSGHAELPVAVGLALADLGGDDAHRAGIADRSWHDDGLDREATG